MLRLYFVAISLIIATSAAAETTTVPVASVSSDVWLRTGPSTSHARISGLPRGTKVVEIAGPDTVFKRRSSRWVRVFVLDGRSEGREGWVWGEFLGCCTGLEWLD